MLLFQVTNKMSTAKTIGVLFVSLLLVVIGIVILVGLGWAASGYSLAGEDGSLIESDKEKTILFQDPFFTHNKVNPSVYELVDCPIKDGVDTDGDGFFDSCDNCPLHYNPEQRDDDYDDAGNACDLTFDLVERDLEPTEPTVECFDHLDCGSDGFVGSEYCSEDDVYQDFKEYTCNNPGTEVSFCSSETMEELVKECEEGCDDGECSVEEPEIECNNDLECGTDGYLNNYCFEDGVHGDYEEFTCNNPGTEDSYCSSNIDYGQFIEWCQEGCKNGECLEPKPEIVCYIDIECEDGNPLTYDQCVNPGTEDSLCSNVGFECNADWECGDDGFDGEDYCVGDDIYQNYVEHMCVDSGMIGAFCNADVEPTFVSSCENACADGTCIVCDENLDCDDGNSLTSDSCILPGTVLSYCENEQFGECTPGDTQSCGFSDVGQCQLGTETCQSNGFWGPCFDAIYPSPEVCDGFDNNCDGGEDEGDVCIPAQCDDGLDNDGDGFTDWPADPGCSSREDDSETPFNDHECNDDIDNDGDGLVDWPEDPSCSSAFDNSESPFDLPQCDDGIDNDSDGKIDWPADSQCSSRLDNNEAL